jgi:O-antigen ligase
MLVIVTGASAIFPLLIFFYKDLFEINRITTIVSLLFFLALLISFITNSSPKSQQLWGVWGRSTGLLTYTAFLVFLLSSSLIGMKSEQQSLRTIFERTSYVITIYTLVQAGGVDPINWSQKAMVATLGNINFMSSFLGLASISFASRLINERLPITAKCHFATFVFLNLYLIWLSGSIQGLGVFAAGMTIVIAFKLQLLLGQKYSFSWLICSSLLGIFVFMGSMGIGPFKMLEQETVIFRLDYWRAGLSMTANNWLNGIGIDSYGDYYEQYRDRAAVTRTGPNRISNTAHNIFIDVSSGSGVITGILFICFYLLVLTSVYKVFKNRKWDSSFVAFSSMMIGFMVFCAISINQIGVGIWGFVFMGYLVGSSRRLMSKTIPNKEKKSHFREKAGESEKLVTNSSINSKIFLSLILGLIGFISAFLPNLTDMQMLTAVKNQNFEEMRKVVGKYSSTSYYSRKYMLSLVDSGQMSQALEFAKLEIARDSRNEVALRIIAMDESVQVYKRREALVALKDRDPKNYEFVREVDQLINQLG